MGSVLLLLARRNEPVGEAPAWLAIFVVGIVVGAVGLIVRKGKRGPAAPAFGFLCFGSFAMLAMAPVMSGAPGWAPWAVPIWVFAYFCLADLALRLGGATGGLDPPPGDSQRAFEDPVYRRRAQGSCAIAILLALGTVAGVPWLLS